MRRDLPALARSAYDLAIIGGGIYGICAAYEAARRGLSACLVERADFMGATSSNSLKTIHGGLRYLQHGDLRRMRQSIRERTALLRMAPHLVRPLPFVLPTYGYGLRGKPAMRTALLLNDLIGFDRNAGVEPGRRLPGGRVMGREEIRSLIPGIDPRGLTGGAVWFDCQVANTERLALAYLHAAVGAGAECANYVDATGILLGNGQVRGIRARDRHTGDGFDVRAHAVLNAAGPWVDQVLRTVPGASTTRRFHPSKAMNLVTRRLFPGQAIGLTVPTEFRDTDAWIDKGARLFFVVPWGQFSLIGTRHFPSHDGPDEFRITDREIETFLAEINAVCPGAGLARRDVLAVLGGMLPEVPRPASREVQLVKHSRLHDHSGEGAAGLISMVGVKWTTARQVAERAVDMVEVGLRPGSVPGRPAERPLPGGEMEDVERFLARELPSRPAGMTLPAMRHILETYGTTYREVLAHLERDPSLGEPVTEGSPVVGAEILHGVEREMAQHLEDVVLRRTALAAGGHPGPEALRRCAELMGSALGWSRERRAAELDRADAVLRGAGRLPRPERIAS